MIISHTFDAGTSLHDKREYLYEKAFNHLGLGFTPATAMRDLLMSLINLRLKGTKCSIEFTEEFKR